MVEVAAEVMVSFKHRNTPQIVGEGVKADKLFIVSLIAKWGFFMPV